MNAGVAEIAVEKDADGEELVLLTVPRNAALLRELRGRLGRRMRAYKVAPQSLTFVVEDEPPASNVVSISDKRLACVRRAGVRSGNGRPARTETAGWAISVRLIR